MESASVLPVTERDLETYLEAATGRVMAVEVAPPRPKAVGEGEGGVALGGRRFAYRPLRSVDGGVAGGGRERVSLHEAIQGVSPGDRLLSDTENLVLRAARRALQVMSYISARYEETSGLAGLKEANRTRSLPAALAPELEKKRRTATAVGLLVGTSYLLNRLAGARADEAEARPVEVAAPPALPAAGLAKSADLWVWYLASEIIAHARDDAGLLAVARAAARAVGERLVAGAAGLEFTDAFTRERYRVESEDLTLGGFELEPPAPRAVIEMVKKRPEEVVGNHLAKFEAMRLAQRLVCYDLDRQRNPFVDLGGFSFSFIGDGSPGTGKTTLIQMTTSLLSEYCEALGLPFQYRNFSVDEISDYQGRSGLNAKRFCREVIDPRGIGFGTVDDVDQVCGNRDDKNASAGQLEVTAVLMQELAGPGTVVRGNATFGLFSNYPEKVDDALRQRTQARFLVDGPQTREDFTDLMYLLLGPSLEMALGEGYEPFSSQQIRKVIQARYAEHDRPQDPGLAALFDEHAKGGAIATWAEFGNYLKALQQHDPRFTGRAVKNITDAVRFRMMDFDLPAEWFEDPTRFFKKPYEDKVQMLEELRGEVTPKVVLQEINRYADSEARYAAAAKVREFETRKRGLVLDARARAAAHEELSG